MTDRAARTAQRTAAYGDAERARWLLQRQRQGRVTSTYTLLAAQLGDPAARRLVAPAPIPICPTGRGEVCRWKRAFRSAGRRPLVALGWWAAYEALEVAQAWGQRDGVYLRGPDPVVVFRLRSVMREVAAWLNEPSRARRRAIGAQRDVSDWFEADAAADQGPSSQLPPPTWERIPCWASGRPG
jgi:hypothetical protein